MTATIESTPTLLLAQSLSCKVLLTVARLAHSMGSTPQTRTLVFSGARGRAHIPQSDCQSHMRPHAFEGPTDRL